MEHSFPGARGSYPYPGQDHGPGQDVQAGQSEAGRLHPLLQADITIALIEVKDNTHSVGADM